MGAEGGGDVVVVVESEVALLVFGEGEGEGRRCCGVPVVGSEE